jgi:hypothetical protein
MSVSNSNGLGVSEGIRVISKIYSDSGRGDSPPVFPAGVGVGSLGGLPALALAITLVGNGQSKQSKVVVSASKARCCPLAVMLAHAGYGFVSGNTLYYCACALGLCWLFIPVRMKRLPFFDMGYSHIGQYGLYDCLK